MDATLKVLRLDRGLLAKPVLEDLAALAVSRFTSAFAAASTWSCCQPESCSHSPAAGPAGQAVDRAVHGGNHVRGDPGEGAGR
ncbi:hypothetical protein J7E91_07675 [Streptomyces sp. ISL-99]|nr:hypothetical protein [Streptomyces sp. ISL-99]